jgi:xanthine dehydrogenase large subunit
MTPKQPSHDSALEHATGRSIYVDDRSAQPNELIVGLLTSSVAHGRITKLETDKASELPGVEGIYTHTHIAENQWGTIFQDQPLLAEREIRYYGQVIAVIAAESQWAIDNAKREIELEIEELDPVFDIKEAFQKNLLVGPLRKIARGDSNSALDQAAHKLTGTLNIAGQDHFYLESQAAVAYPDEAHAVEIHCSSQHPTEVQHLVAHALGLPLHKVVAIVKRMGGAFGGKESQAAPFAVYAALAAFKLNRPARLILSKDDDMQITGGRNPFAIDYQVGFDDNGTISVLKASLYSDAGAYADLSTAIMERAMLHIDNAYFIPNMNVEGQVCRTNKAPTTAFRGFGGPKGVVTIEGIIEDIATHLNLDALDIRQRNCYQKTSNNSTHYDQTLKENPLPDLFAQLRQSSHYDRRRQEIETYNSSDTPFKRGMSLTAVKFGISFTTRFLNQGAALVNLHTDGTAQVSTGATEMGQGVNTKISQVVADELGISASSVRLMPTSTEKIANTSPTAASSGSDINGQAALAAARKIRLRLAQTAVRVFDRPTILRGRPVAGAGTAPEITLDGSEDIEDIVFENHTVSRLNRPEHRISFVELIEEAYLNRISLCDHGYYRYPGIHFNKETGKGEPFLYFTNGAANSEVEINRDTGELKVLRTDILMDLGRSLNEGIDIGQVTGAFVQGMGWVTTEALYYNSKGQLISHGPSTYKIPSVHDTPRVFNVELLENPHNTSNLRGSKAVGEPPLMLGISVWSACKDALRQRRNNNNAVVALPVPATAEALLMAMLSNEN